MMFFLQLKMINPRNQGRINHWGNRANARGLAIEYQNILLLVFHVFKLFTTRQNCFLMTAFRVYVKETDNFGIYRF